MDIMLQYSSSKFLGGFAVQYNSIFVKIIKTTDQLNQIL